VNLIAELYAYDRDWRANISPDPIEAAIEIGLIEPEETDPDCQPLDFNDA
jgi:hypothetical protein